MVFNRASLVVIFSIKVNLLNCNQAWEQAFGVRGKEGGGIALWAESVVRKSV